MFDGTVKGYSNNAVICYVRSHIRSILSLTHELKNNISIIVDARNMAYTQAEFKRSFLPAKMVFKLIEITQIDAALVCIATHHNIGL